MKPKLLVFIFSLISLFRVVELKAQAADPQDSLALVDLYNNTNGPAWLNHTNWLSTMPVSTWYGVNLYNGKVELLLLGNNNLAGVLPASLGNLSLATVLDFHQNQLTGNVPASLGTLQSVVAIDLTFNQLSGTLPSSLENLPYHAFFRIEHNNYLYDGLEYLFSKMSSNEYFLLCSPQATLHIHQNGNLLSVTAGGTLANNTYRWYSPTRGLVSLKTGDSTFTATIAEDYTVSVTNNVVNNNPTLFEDPAKLVLFGVLNSTAAHIQDSLALVDLYNSTNGPGWTNNYNWLTAAPINTWQGVTLWLDRLEKVKLPSNNLTGNIPPSLLKLTTLGFIDLSYNNLTGDLAPVNNLFSLSELNLSFNQLTGKLPSSLGRTSQIAVLDLSHNLFSDTIPFELGNQDYTQMMNLGFNQLTGQIPDSFKILKNLQELYLNNNQLTGKIPDSLGRLIHLKQINFNSNQFIGPLPDFRAVPSLQNFTVSNNNFNFDGMETLPVSVNPPVYAPQASIVLNRNGNLFSVSAGGNVSNDTFRLYKNGILDSIKSGDSTFVIESPGQYYISITNKLAPNLTLQSTTYNIAGLVLADSAVTITQYVSGLNTIEVEDTPYHKLMLSITPIAGANALSGNVDCKVILDPAVNTYNNQPYVQRHYDIVPAVSPSTAMATVKLYFTQADFDNFNASPAHGADLPIRPTDAAGIANLRVYQYHGFSATSLPGSYSGPAVEIDPADANIVWNSNGQYWEVSFDVNGFSGFFVSSLNSALLPVKLISFTGKLQGNSGLLQWVTANEINSSYFELQRSVNGNNFDAITTIPAAGNSNGISLNYQYTDQPKSAGVYYYRLKMTDKDGRFTFANVIKLNYAGGNPNMSVYPNPANKSVLVNFPQTTGITTLKMIDMAGRVVKTVPLPKGVMQLRLNLNGLPVGMYKLISDNGKEAVDCSLIIK
jgi:Leucine-rich repeat (LRR) protein